ncbi:MAG: hypothetical protein JST76_04755 [Bacteroidetes bacterium]|nr:hypothetical protein [Bacteroidota bacterium]
MDTQLPSSPLYASVRRSCQRREKALMMGKLSKFILFFYVLSLLRPAVPMVADLVAHTFYEQEHIMMVHEVKGRFHIHDEIGKNLSHSEQEKGNVNSVDVVEYCHASIVHLPPAPSVCSSSIHIAAIPCYPSHQMDILSPPPCV